MAALAPVIKHRFFDSNGDPLAGGKLYSYIAGTSTPLGTFTDSTGGTPNANPVILDANGESDVWIGSGTYKFILKNSLDVTQWTVDNVVSAAAPPTAWSEHAVTDAQSATDLTGETIDFASYSSVDYDFEILRGTTVIANGSLSIQDLNGTGRIIVGGFRADEVHGVTFTITQTTTVAQLRAALDTGAGNGTIKLRKTLIPV